MARQRGLLIVGLTLVTCILLTSVYFISRAVNREFEVARVQVDLVHRPRRRHAFHPAAVDLDGEDRTLGPLVGVGPDRGEDQVAEGPEDLVLGEAPHLFERPVEPRVRLFDPLLTVGFQRRVESGGERSMQGPRHLGVAVRAPPPPCGL